MRSWAKTLLFVLILKFSFDSGATASTSSDPPSPSCLPHAIPPIAIPIRNVTMQSSGFRRGAALSIGTPPQELAFNPVSQMNATHIYDLSSPCAMHSKSIFVDPNATQAQCVSSYGGVFDESKSSSWTTASSASVIGISDDYLMNVSMLYANNYGNTTSGVDTFLPTSNISMTRQPFVVLHGSNAQDIDVPSEPYLMNSLGLGTNSTLLNGLFSAGNISSRIWSYWNGWTGANSQNQSDGSLILGGYDAGLAYGHNVTVKFTTDLVDLYQTDCNLIVTVSDMQLKFPNGTMASLLGSSRGKSVRYCIIPSFPGINLTNDTWVSFMDQTNTQLLDDGTQRSYSHLSYWNNVVKADNVYEGDLVISIDPGLDIVIPNHELVQPLVDINPAGQEYIVNGSEVRLLAFDALDQIQLDQLPVLGQPLFSSAYIMVDNDQRQATLWAARPGQEQDLVAVGPPGCPLGPPSIVSPTSSPQHAPNTSSSLSKGGISGIAVGAVSVVCISLGLGYLLAKRRKRGQHTNLESETPMDLKAELSSDHHPSQEMPLGKAGFLSPKEMSGDVGFRRAEMWGGGQGLSTQKRFTERERHEMPGDYGVIEMPSTPGNRGPVEKLAATPEVDKSRPSSMLHRLSPSHKSSPRRR